MCAYLRVSICVRVWICAPRVRMSRTGLGRQVDEVHVVLLRNDKRVALSQSVSGYKLPIEIKLMTTRTSVVGKASRMAITCSFWDES